MQNQKRILPPPALMDSKQVCARLSICTSWLHRLVQQGRFPKPIKLGKRAARWPAEDVDDWIDEQIRGGAL